jgi:PPM family protein phosphatase
MSRTNRSEIRTRIPRIATQQPDFRVVGHGASDVGRRREVNEDSYLILPKNHIWVVADGMGGHAGGQVASTLTVEMVARSLIRRLSEAEEVYRTDETAADMPALITAAIKESCAAVFDSALHQPHLRGMGSTVTAMLVTGSVAWFGHVGDSRAYLVRDGKIHQVTEDHTWVQEQVSAGLITEEQARNSMIRNIITRSIGFERDVRVDVGAVPLVRGDQFLLCSDGLTGHVEDDELLEMIELNHRRSVPAQLIDLANSRGGEDNTTVILTTVVSRRGHGRSSKRRKPTR